VSPTGASHRVLDETTSHLGEFDVVVLAAYPQDVERLRRGGSAATHHDADRLINHGAAVQSRLELRGQPLGLRPYLGVRYGDRRRLGEHSPIRTAGP
jgi:hypothetical protein